MGPAKVSAKEPAVKIHTSATAHFTGRPVYKFEKWKIRAGIRTHGVIAMRPMVSSSSTWAFRTMSRKVPRSQITQISRKAAKK